MLASFLNKNRAFMRNPEDRNQEINKNEDEISASITDANAKEKPADDAFKTPNRKHRMGWEVPMDEQAFDDTDLSRKDPE